MLQKLISQFTQFRQNFSQLIPTAKLPPPSLRFFIVVVLLIGIFFRFYNLDRKVYWHDEAYTSLRISGYTTKDVIQQIFNGTVINGEDLQKFQKPNQAKNLGDTLISLATEDPQHPPLYYVLARWWIQIFGYSVATIRSLSALISLLVFPAVYWLCKELFGKPQVGLIAIALIAVSPFHVLFAQEAREYVLWTVTTLLSSAALLHALRLNTRRSWVIYSVTLALGFYTFLFTGLVAIGHGIYVLITAGLRFSQRVKYYLLASLGGVLAFAPWLFVLMIEFDQFQKTTAWTTQIIAPSSLMKGWVGFVNSIFMDFDQPVLKYLSLPIILTLFCFTLYFMIHKSSRKIGLFILILIGSTAIPLMLPDVIFGGIRSLNRRYLIPCVLGIELAVAYMLAIEISSASFFKRRIWQVAIATIITGGLLSCAVSSQAETWWIKSISNSIPQIARLINQANQPLVISNLAPSKPNLGHLLALSYLVEPEVKFQLVNGLNIPRISIKAGDVFLFNPSETFRLAVEQQRQAKAKKIFQGQYNIELWKLPNRKS